MIHIGRFSQIWLQAFTFESELKKKEKKQPWTIYTFGLLYT
jgi:hypothetical protein